MTKNTSAAVSRGFHGSYLPDDVTFLLKPAEIPTIGIAEKEAAIQGGTKHYSEMISAEKVPNASYMDLFHKAVETNGQQFANDISTLGFELYKRNPAGDIVILSLARAGTPIGVLLKRIMTRNGVRVFHYSISIIRGRGIDRGALNYVLSRHAARDIVFVDGWTGKGAIAKELASTLEGTGVEPFLAVVADPAGCANLAATARDYVIPSGILNGIVSGLVSRTVLNSDFVGPGDFHACLMQQHLAPHDISLAFVDKIEKLIPHFPASADGTWRDYRLKFLRADCESLISSIMAETSTSDVNKIKPGIAESTRAILRRMPKCVYLADRSAADVGHIVHLAEQGGVRILPMPIETAYRAVTVINSLGSE